MQPNVDIGILCDISLLCEEIYRARGDLGFIEALPPLQKEIAGIWRKFTGLNFFNLDDDLFQVGGDSIVAVQILSAINSEFDIDIPMGALFASDRFSVTSLEELVETYQINSFGDEYTTLLAEIESLSDEQVELKLASHNP